MGDGTVPNAVIELKSETASKSAAEQITRYLKWFYIILGKEASKITVYIAAPSFAITEKLIPLEYRSQVKFVELSTNGKTQTRLMNG